MTEQRPLQPTPVGAFRFNIDTARLEYFNGNEFVTIISDSPEKHTGGTRGVIFGGYNSPGNGSNMIGHINISTTGNEVDSGGNLIAARYGMMGASDRTRGLGFGGRNDPSPAASVDQISYFTISIGNDAIDFGNLLSGQGWEQMTAFSDSTRGIVGGGYQNPQSPTTKNIISYVTIQSLGDAVDFGDLSVARGASCPASSPTRGLFIGGRTGPGNDSKVTTIDFVTTSTLGNAADFGDQVTASSHSAGCSNAVRAITGLGFQGSGYTNRVNVIEFITIATLGNAQDFGDLTSSEAYGNSASASDCVRAVRMGGGNGNANTIDYVLIATQGDAVDFGDLTTGQGEGAGCSNAHGGL